MKRRLFATIPLFFMLTGLALLPGCSKQEAEQEAAAPAAAAVGSDTAASDNTENKNLIVGVDATFPPMEFRNPDGVLMGYDIDMATEAFKRAGLKFEYKSIDWTKKDDELLKDRTVDVLWSGLGISEERKKIYGFSKPYLKNRQVILVRIDSLIATKDDLGGKIVGTQAGGWVHEILDKFSGTHGAIGKLISTPETANALALLLSGKLDAVVADEVQVRYFVSRSPGKFKILDDNFGESSFGVGTRPDDTALLDKIDRALTTMELDGTAQTIYAKWFEVKKQ